MNRTPLLFLLVLACSGEPAAKPELTQRQRDSAIGASRLPGAQGVNRALQAQDSANSRNAQLDSIN